MKLLVIADRDTGGWAGDDGGVGVGIGRGDVGRGDVGGEVNGERIGEVRGVG